MKQRLNTFNPNLTSLLNAFKEVIFSTLNCHKVAKIISFDAGNQTARAEMIVQKEINGKIIEYPVLVDCPVFVLSGGNARITFPVASGDSCLVVFNDEDMDNWFATGSKQVAATNRRHSFTDGLIFVGFRHQANKITDYSASNLQIKKGNMLIDISDSQINITDGTAKITVTGGNITIDGGNVSVKGTGNLELQGTAVNITGTLSINGTPYLQHTHSGVTGGPSNTGGVAS